MCLKDVERPQSLIAKVLTGFISESDTAIKILTNIGTLVRPMVLEVLLSFLVVVASFNLTVPSDVLTFLIIY